MWWLIVVGAVILIVAVYLWVTGYQSDNEEDRATKLEGKYSTKMGRFAARKEAKAAHARTNLSTQVTAEIGALASRTDAHRQVKVAEFNIAHDEERLQQGLDVERSRNQVLLDQNQLTRQLIGEASLKRIDVATYLELQKKIEFDRLELDKQWREAENQLKAGFIYQLQAHQHLALMTEYIGKLYDRAHDLQAQGKTREHALIEEHIAFMEGDFRGRQRLLQAAEQEDIQGSYADSDS
jgi:hypothetical protein